MKILIIDSSKVSAADLQDKLTSAGYPDTTIVNTFELAMNTLSTSIGINAIDLVLIDPDLLKIDSTTAILTIKSQHDFENIPIIVITGHDDETLLDRAFAAGASDYIVKPVSRIELRARARSILQLRLEMTKRMERERELEQLARELERMSNRDGLTGIANRRCFDDILVQEWVRNGRADTELGLLMIDIDHFKHYNDALGHLDGDTCLCAVAEAISSAVHRPGDMVARYGGEEFAVILPNTDYRGARTIADTIHTNLKKTCIRHPNSSVGCTVTVSIGVTSAIPTCQTTPENLIHAADCALYQAKQAGRNRTEIIRLPDPNDLRQ
ncbi:MAG: diguanylate cyclase [Pseudodesulfovibrio sp.]|nr:diguanylate cyclase [Pseudodesulfovibrio sp.]